MRILLVEDDVMLGESMVASLSRQGYTVDWLERGSGVLTALKTETFTAIILDIMLPDISGFTVLKQVRQANFNIPVMILTARDEINDRVRGLDGGADDYLVKPFALEELLARLRVMIRRLSGTTENQLEVNGLVLNLDSQSVTYHGEALKLTVNEYKILSTLLSSAGRVLSKEQLIQSLHGWDEGGSDNAIEVHIHNLRRKLDSSVIKNIRGVGYIIEK
ncbi:response regulator [Vibrio salinus]|uniref:response regulator n=1 Tax=Vibrio salinus TaxID=2899784 RepID=UPI001E620A45|nr:response regulator transcription factor [Vibrio salinus]MCE0494922.1 response regulator transcription factor [Vibrio salinus]